MAFLTKMKQWNRLSNSLRWITYVIEKKARLSEDQYKELEAYNHAVLEKKEADPANKNLSLTRLERWLVRRSMHRGLVYGYDNYVEAYAPPPVNVPHPNRSIVFRRSGFMVAYEICMNTVKNPGCKTCKWMLRCQFENPGTLNAGDIKYLGRWKEHVSWMK